MKSDIFFQTCNMYLESVGRSPVEHGKGQIFGSMPKRAISLQTSMSLPFKAINLLRTTRNRNISFYSQCWQLQLRHKTWIEMSCERLRIFDFPPMTLLRRKPILYTYSVNVGFLTVISFCSFFSMSMFSSCTGFTSHCIPTSGTHWLLFCSGTQNRTVGLAWAHCF